MVEALFRSDQPSFLGRAFPDGKARDEQGRLMTERYGAACATAALDRLADLHQADRLGLERTLPAGRLAIHTISCHRPFMLPTMGRGR